MNIEEIESGGYRIGIPVPFPMKYVYCYLFPQNNDYVLIDVGFNYQAAREAWEEVFTYLKISPLQIKTIYLTHFHPDHSGLCGWMQQQTGAHVFMHEIDMQMMERVWGDDSVQTTRMKEMILDSGVPVPLSEAIIEHMEKITKHVLPLPKMTPIGRQVEFSGKIWDVIHTPGHSAGHICFYQKEDQILISGDHVLDKITPNISVWPGSSQEPLHEYIDSLLKIKQFPTKIVYSAHGKLIDDLNDRVDELILHHEERLLKMEQLANTKTAYEIAEVLFAHKDLSPHQWRFAIAETLAHLYFLVQENRVVKIGTKPVVYQKVI
ncbi:MBL fold metallo-hydrolase [Halalkalibacter alkalisediminis]|uniref:MBL fold metallo-hydrolase n=1 Tax=Halalkalibacter alkalisediminis TaxID=935616 RepID=A0ABV6NC77_9BACI|nr:MBL fold metallo-hydrolase [Halalkalibacter alkalisediminis]